ncbi:MAG: type II toxin-antitoxin system prevent-host-death family antitoxin [Planctomycetia bacterium]|nr:type II toxin-antitoxin system prevent-host-death family antitoxin [Planctomycetia bacterium]
MLEVLNISDARKNLRQVLQRVTREDGTVVITRKNGENAAIISLRRLNQMEKAIQNAQYLAMLDKSMKELEDGKVVLVSDEELEGLAI